MVNAMREMKDSGKTWIGYIPEECEVVRLKHGTYMKGRIGWQGLKSQDFIDAGPYCVTSTDFQGGKVIWERCYHVSEERYAMDPCIQIKKGDILISKDGTIGKLAIIDELPNKACLNSHLLIIRPSNRYTTKYLYYVLSSDVFVHYYSLVGSGSTMQSLSQEKLGEFSFPIWSISQQELITSFLDAKCSEIDALSADIQSEIDILEAYKRSVITEAVTKGLDKNVPMKDSGIEWVGMAPQHWDFVKGKYCLKYMQKPVKDDDGVITCFRDGEVTLRSNRREEGFTMSDKEIGYQGIDAGDLVVHGMDGFAGAIGISDSRGKASPVLNVLDSDANKKYIMYYLRSMAYGDVFVALATGIRVRSCDLRWNKLAELLYPIPPKKEQDEIVAYIDNQLQRANEIIKDKQEQLEVLLAYKKSLIYEYVTGKKEVET